LVAQGKIRFLFDMTKDKRNHNEPYAILLDIYRMIPHLEHFEARIQMINIKENIVKFKGQGKNKSIEAKTKGLGLLKNRIQQIKDENRYYERRLPDNFKLGNTLYSSLMAMNKKDWSEKMGQFVKDVGISKEFVKVQNTEEKPVTLETPKGAPTPVAMPIPNHNHNHDQNQNQSMTVFVQGMPVHHSEGIPLFPANQPPAHTPHQQHYMIPNTSGIPQGPSPSPAQTQSQQYIVPNTPKGIPKGNMDQTLPPAPLQSPKPPMSTPAAFLAELNQKVDFIAQRMEAAQKQQIDLITQQQKQQMEVLKLLSDTLKKINPHPSSANL
jgi:hypothetical protein